MTNVSFHGTGTTTPAPDQVGIGEGLQAGLTEVDFDAGSVSLVDNTGHPTNIGRFLGLHGSDSQGGAVKAIVFKSSVVCTIIIDKMQYVYQNLNQWVTFNHVNTSRMQILRTPTGQTTDVFDWDFNASDDPEYRLTIQTSDKTSQSEVLFSSVSRNVGTYTTNCNLRGAKKIIVTGLSPASAETGTAVVTAEVLDSASGQWINLIPTEELFNGLSQGVTKIAQFGDTIGKPLTTKNSYLYKASGTGSVFSAVFNHVGATDSNPIAGFVPPTGYVLPTGDNIFRIKVVISSSSLTLSIGITKVFD